MALGEHGKLSREHRENVYRYQDCHPTTTETADLIGRVQWLKEHNDKRLFRRVLDIGCHDGFLSRWLLRGHSCELLVGVEIGQDATLNAVEQALIDQDVEGPMAIYLNQSWEEFNQPLQFTEVLLCELLEHFPHEENVALVKKAHRYLVTGGRGFITTPDPEGPFGVSNPDPHHINLMDVQQLDALLGDADESIRLSSHIEVMPDGIIYATWEK